MKIKYLAGIILIFALAACGNDGVKSGTSPKPQGGEVKPQVGEANRQGNEANSQGNEGSAPYTGVKWVAVGGTESNPAVTLSSKDGINWTEKTYGEDAKLYDVYYAKGKWIAVGAKTIATTIDNGNATTFYTYALMLSSPDGITWANISPKDDDDKAIPGSLDSVYYADSKWIVVGKKRYDEPSIALILSSPDGITWANISPKDDDDKAIPGSLDSVYYADSKWIAVGFPGSNSDVPLIQKSGDNGDTWETIVITTDGYFQDIAYGTDRWIAVGGVRGDPLLMESTHGLSWTTKTPTGVKGSLQGIAHGAGKWIAVGYNGTILKRTNAAWSTIDTSAITDFDSTSILSDVVHANGQFIAVGAAGAILTSPDGDAWTKRDSKTTKTLYGIAAYRE